MNTKTSVILPTYNGSRFLAELMESLKRQSLPADEVLILDDNSSDDTASLVENFINENRLDNWKLIRSISQSGWKVNFWEGMKKASGDLIFPCDQDDIWHKDKIKIMTGIMNTHPGINVLRCERRTFKGSSDEYISSSKKDVCSSASETLPEQDRLYRRSFNTLAFPGCTICTRKEFINRIDPYWTPEFPYDSYLYRMSVLTDSMYRITLTDTPLLFQRIHENNTSIGANNTGTYEYKLQDAVRKEAESRALMDYAFAVNRNKGLAEGTYNWSRTRLDLYRTLDLKYAVKLLKYLNYYWGYRIYLDDLKTICDQKKTDKKQ